MQGANRPLIRKLSNRNIRKNKKRSFLLITVIAILMTLITTLNILSQSTYKNLEYAYFQRYGNMSHVQLEGVVKQEEKSIEGHMQLKGYGKSIWIGDAVNKEFAGRPTQIGYGDRNYAKYALALPSQGRMPENGDEIALDTSVLADLDRKAGLGEKVRIEWIGQEGLEKSHEFIITGIWEGNEECPNRKMWVAKAFADKAAGRTDIALMFKEDDDIKAAYEDIKAKAALDNVTVKMNWVYDSHARIEIGLETIVYGIGIGCVLLCGFLVLYNIVQISVITNIKLYGRMITIGATSRQVRFAILRQMHLLAFAGIAAGLFIGYALGMELAPVILGNGIGTVIEAENAAGLIAAAILTYLLVMSASVLPAVKAGRVKPSDLLSEENIYSFHKHRSRRIPGLPALLSMSIAYIGRFSRRNTITILLLSAGLVGISCISVVNSSFDVEKYMRAAAISDFTISEKTLVSGWGSYDTRGSTITEAVLAQVDRIEGVREKGKLYSQDVPVKVTGAAYENITGYYEQNNGQILKDMGENSFWSKGYRRLKDTCECTVAVFGIDGIVCDRIFSGAVLEGTIDKERFIRGNYAIAKGFAGSNGANKKQPTYNVGEKVNIDGKEYEIMAIMEIPYPITEGREDEDAAFSLQFFIPAHQFKEQYPENTIRRLFFNVDDAHRQTAELFAQKHFKDKGIPVISQKSLTETYEKETKAVSLITNVIVLMVFAIGIINLLNTLITSVYVRRKEFAVMQSIGMTKKQLRILLALEGLSIIGISLFLSYFISFIAISTGVKIYLSAQWTSTYHFSMAALLILTPVLVLTAAIVPIICIRNIQKEELMDRLYGDVEMGNSL